MIMQFIFKINMQILPHPQLLNGSETKMRSTGVAGLHLPDLRQAESKAAMEGLEGQNLVVQIDECT